MTDSKKFERVWYAHGFLREMVLIYPTYAIMMQQGGISAIELSTLFVIWSFALFVFEVPAGVLADRVSRRNLLVVAGLIKGSVFLIWWFMPNFAGYALGFVVWSLGSSFMSGTAEALLHDNLEANGTPEEFERIYGWGVAAHSLGIATALLIGGGLAESGFLLPLLLSVIAPWGAAIIVALGLDEPPRSTASHVESFVGTFFSGIREARSSRSLAIILGMFATLPVAYSVLDEYVGPMLYERGTFSLMEIGAVAAFALAARTLGVSVAHRFRAPSTRRLAALFMTSGFLLVAIGSVADYGLALLLGSYFAVCGAGEVLLQGQLQANIRGPARATITSFARMGMEATAILLYLFLGTIAQFHDWESAFAATGIMSVLLALFFVVLGPGKKRDTPRM
ncbi:MAG: MFS transporter [Gammaproteobacteria bacterium]|nr:MFS transporter [Gammaproteobacteria bacterium]